MASVITERNGRKMVRFKAPNGKYPKIRLGKIDQRVAEEIKDHVEHLAGCWRDHKSPLPATDKWTVELLKDPARVWLYDRLAAVGLVGPREKPAREPKTAKAPEKASPHKLAAFIDTYINGRTGLEESSVNNLRCAARYLVEKFGEDTPLADISLGDADEYRDWLHGKVADATTRRYCAHARAFFRAAVRKRLIPENPFGDMKDLNVKKNKEREFFVTREVSNQVLNEMVDANESPLVEWQVIFALSRYGALRCPSEHLLLTWEDVAWEEDKFTVHSPKTKRYEGKETRVVPLFPELRPYLEAAFNQACDRLGRPPSGTDHVIVKFRYRGGKTNLRTGLLRFLKKAGVKAWPKLFQNLRASRSTELAASYPGYVAAAWCGHDEDTAKEHYWQITEDHWALAATKLTGEAVPNPGQKVATNRPQTEHKPSVASGPGESSRTQKTPENPEESGVFTDPEDTGTAFRAGKSEAGWGD
ncbi:MAG: site-specific integrase [Planctomycetota bacterium]|nr:site-specific integrase [Planctomycetota bacterium]